MGYREFSCKIVHELPKRIRISSGLLFDTNMDPTFLHAVMSNIMGVENVRLNLKAGSIIVNYNGTTETREAIINFIKRPGDEIFQEESLEIEHPADSLGAASKSVMALLSGVLPKEIAAPISAGLSFPIILEGIDTLINDGVKVEVLDASAILFSLARGDFFTASSIAALLSIGTYLEEMSEKKSTDLLQNLLKPKVDQIWVERNGREIQVEIRELEIGDIVICGAGELIPVDGVVDSGEALVNQSSITGESVPVHLKPGDNVLSGSVVDEGKIKINAVQVGSNTGMARVSRFLEQSLKSKSKSQKQSDELADKLVPITFALGMGIYLATGDISRAASVLTVDYSCAIKIATPVAVKMSMFNAANQGSLLKGAEALDTLSRIDTIVFDKTGTLTIGHPEVTDILTFGKMDDNQLLAIAAGAEEHYDHPVANAVLEAANQRDLELPYASEVDFIVAHGVSAYVDDKPVLVGSRHFIEDDEGIDCSVCNESTQDLMNEGKSLLYVSVDGSLAGVVALEDQIRPEAKDVLSSLKKTGIKKIVVLTGDHQTTAKVLAKRLPDIDEIHWELKPEDKASILSEIKSDGSIVAFTGDGVNDAPAMVTADLGICMPEGADLAKDAAQLVLLEEDLNALVNAIEISKNNKKTIVNSFRSAVGINSLILLFASTGKLSPFTAAVMHNTSTLGILGYSALSNKVFSPENKKEENSILKNTLKIFGNKNEHSTR